MNTLNEKLDILITGGTLLTMAAPGEIIEEPFIGIRDGKILFVEKGPFPPESPRKPARSSTPRAALVMPGLVNAHTHLPMVLFRGLADDLPLMTWLNDHIFPAEATFHQPRDRLCRIHAGHRRDDPLRDDNLLRRIFFRRRRGRAAIDCGMRGVIAQGFIDFPTPDQPDSSRHRQQAERFVRRWQDRSPLVTPSLVCHSPYTCSPDTLRTIKAVTTDAGITLSDPSRRDPRRGRPSPGTIRKEARPSSPRP